MQIQARQLYERRKSMNEQYLKYEVFATEKRDDCINTLYKLCQDALKELKPWQLIKKKKCNDLYDEAWRHAYAACSRWFRGKTQIDDSIDELDDLIDELDDLIDDLIDELDDLIDEAEEAFDDIIDD